MEAKKCSFGEIRRMGNMCAMEPEYTGDTREIQCDYCKKYAHIYCDKTLVSKRLPDLYKCLICKGTQKGFRKKLEKTKKKREKRNDLYIYFTFSNLIHLFFLTSRGAPRSEMLL